MPVIGVIAKLAAATVYIWVVYNQVHDMIKKDEDLPHKQISNNLEYSSSSSKLMDVTAPLECSPLKHSVTASHPHPHPQNNNLTWVLACELYRKPQNGIIARAVLRFRPKLSLQIRLVKGSDHKQVQISTAEAKTLLSSHHFDSSPDHLLVLPFVEMATQHGKDEQIISITHVPTLVGSTSSFTTSQLKVGKNIASAFLQYYKS